MGTRPFRFGVQISETRAHVAWIKQAKRAEALGYDILVMPDHVGDQFAIGPALAVVAGATTTLRIGTLVVQNDLRHPALVAMDAATLDVLSDGRFELGLGAGGSWMPDYERTGIAFDPPGVRVARLAEALQVMKGLFADDPLTFLGRHYTITDLEGFPKPVQRPHPPIMIGGGGPRMLSLAAQEADIISIFPSLLPAGGNFKEDESTTEAVARKIELIRGVAGERFERIGFNVLVQAVVVADDREAAIAKLSEEWGEAADGWLDSPHVYVGNVEQIAEQLQRYRDTLGISYFVVFERHMQAFAPVVARLAGR